MTQIEGPNEDRRLAPQRQSPPRAPGRRPRRKCHNRRMADPKSVPRFSAATLEQVCLALSAAVRRDQIANLVGVLKVNESASVSRGSKRERLFSAVWEAQTRQGDGRPLLRLVGEVMYLVRLESSEDFEAHRLAISERLRRSGYRVRMDGKVARVQQVTTMAEAPPPSDPGAEEETPRVSWWTLAGALFHAYQSQPHREAAASHDRGDKFFHCEIEDGGSTSQVLESIEGQGWQLENASYHEREGAQVGRYLFRRADL